MAISNESSGSSLGAVNAHAALTTNVHGIANTADVTKTLQAPINVRHSAFGAVGDGVTDDTAAFEAALLAAAAAGVYGGDVFVPPGSYRVGDLELGPGQRIHGTRGQWGGGSMLKAKTGASFVLRITGNQRCCIEDLYLDGNAKASSGLRIDGTGGVGATSQMQYLKGVVMDNCNVCVDVINGSPNQADKNTYIACEFANSNIGYRTASSNSQQQEFINCSWDTVPSGLIMSGGGGAMVSMIGGGFQSTGTFITISGPSCSLNLKDVITEGHTNDIVFSGTVDEKLSLGIYLEHCTLQGSDYIIDPGLTSLTQVTAVHCQFNNGKVGRATSPDFQLYDHHCWYASGAVYVPGTGSDRQVRWHYNGFHFRSHDSEILSMATSSTPVSLVGKTGQTAPLQKNIVNTTLKSQINSSGEHVSDDATKGIVLKDTQGTPHYWRITVSNAGALVITDAGTTRPD